MGVIFTPMSPSFFSAASLNFWSLSATVRKRFLSSSDILRKRFRRSSSAARSNLNSDSRKPTRNLRQSKSAFQLKAARCTERSAPSGPAITSRTIAQSSTARQIGPSLSWLHESAIAPVRGTCPNVGRNPVHPHRVLGEEIEPSVSEPTLKPTQPAAVAEDGPAEEPLEP